MEKKKKFEDQVKEKKKIINELENGNTDLEESIKKYTKAMKLVKECDEKLKNMEETVHKIVTEHGELEAFEVEE